MSKKLPNEIKLRTRKTANGEKTVYVVNLQKFGGGRPTRHTLADALALLDQARAEDHKGVFIAPHLSPTFNEVVGKHDDEPRSYKEYIKLCMERGQFGEGEYGHKLNACKVLCALQVQGTTLGEIKFCEIKTGFIQLDVIPALFKGYANKTGRNIFSVFGQVIKYAKLREYIAVNPVVDKQVILPAAPIGVDNVGPRIARDHIEAIIDAANPYYAMRIKFAAYTGLRFGEQVALTWDNVDLERFVVKVRRAWKQCGTIGEPKTKAAIRDVNLGAPLVADLREWRLRQSPHLARHNLVFPHHDGYLPPRNNWRVGGLYPACDCAGVERIKWHHLRHFFASLLLFELQTTDAVVTQLMGHKDISVTRDKYGHWLKDNKRDEAISAQLTRAMGGI